jgi:hypothetical protein
VSDHCAVEGEDDLYCDRCGRGYTKRMGWWQADDDLWAFVTGRSDGSGRLCADCFGTMAREKGIGLGWHPEIDWIDEW